MTNIQEFIITASMVGLGLLIAIYSLVFPQIDKIVEKNTKKLNELIKKRDKMFKKLSKERENTTLTEEYKLLQDEIKYLKKVPFHYNWGFFLTAVFFTISLFVTITDMFYPTFWKGLEVLPNNSPIFLLVGTIIFIIVWFKIMIDLRTLIMTRLELAINKEEKGKLRLEKRERKNTKPIYKG